MSPINGTFAVEHLHRVLESAADVPRTFVVSQNVACESTKAHTKSNEVQVLKELNWLPGNWREQKGRPRRAACSAGTLLHIKIKVTEKICRSPKACTKPKIGAHRTAFL